jgi:hypothetical protein
MGTSDPHDQLLLVAGSKDQAEAAAQFLSTQGIPTTIKKCPGGVIEFGATLSDVELRVRQEDLGRARSLLEAKYAGLPTQRIFGVWMPPPGRPLGS